MRERKGQMRPFLCCPFFVFQRAHLTIHSATCANDRGARNRCVCSIYCLIAATVHKCQLTIAIFFSNHDPHVNNDDLEIMGSYCREWKSPHQGLKPKSNWDTGNKLGHKKRIGPSLYIWGKAQRVIKL